MSTGPVTRDLRNLDLNLLTSLEALLREQNVTRAAERLGLSQPAVSAALGRLRRHFNDELLHRDGNRYELTPLAERLLPPTEAVLQGVRRVFDATPDFDPATSEREFVLHMSDYALTVLGDPLSQVLAERAPGIRVRFLPNSAEIVDGARETLRTCDGIVIPRGFIADVPSLPVFEDEWVCVVSRGNERVGGELTMDLLAELPWVLSYHRPTAYTPASRQLRLLGVEPRAQMIVEGFVAVPFLVAGSDRVAVLQSRLAHRFADAAGIRILACPWDTPPVRESMFWHPQNRADPAHGWLRDVLGEAGRRVGVAGVVVDDGARAASAVVLDRHQERC